MKLMPLHDQIDIAHVRSALVGTRFAAHLRHFPSVASTSTLLLEGAASGAPEGTVTIADEQTAGRGRGSHAWHSSPGEGLYVSILVRPALRLHDALLLSLATGLAVQQAVLETTTLTADSLDLRWPNDLMLRDPATDIERKLGGILVETAVEPGHHPLLRYAVIGIGLNVHHTAFPLDLADQATSLHLAITHNLTPTPPPLLRAPLLIAILRHLDLELLDLESTSPAARQALLARFAAASTWVRGKRVHVPEQGGYTGTTAGLDPRGFLLVDADDGHRRTVLSGGVREPPPILDNLSS
jgi:BirA family biotin operon repressor/biotin-[acetyl-CoA-carboxylase] ligase